jgi:RNA polymerase sigma-70 factor (family 1)
MPTEDKILPGENELFLRMANGDEAAFEEIFHHYTAFLYPFLLNKTKSHELSEEIIQEVFLKLWDKKEILPTIENYRSYIMMMAVNRAYSYFKKAAFDKKTQQQLWHNISLHQNTTHELVELREMEVLINRAVEQLPPAQKKIYLLSRQKGLSHDEIAAELNISKRTVSNQVTSALQSIKEYLSKYPGASVTVIMIILKHFRS